MRRPSVLRCTQGSLVLETALSMMITVPFVFSVFEVCMMTHTYATLNDAARQGVRYAVSHGADNSNCSGPSTGCSDPTAANIQSLVRNEAKLSGHNLTAMVVSANYLDNSSAPGARVQVAIKYPYSPFVVYPAFQQTINVSAEGRIVY